MQMEDYLYQKDLYQPLEDKSKKPTTMSDGDWNLLDRKALGAVRLCLSSSVAFNISGEKTTKGVMDKLAKMYEKPSASNKVYLMKKLFNMKMNEGSSVQDHVNEFNTITNQLTSVKIEFEDEVRALLILCSLPDSWNSFVMAVSNSSSNAVLVFDEVVGTILSEDMRRKSTGECSNATLTIETRGRSRERRRSKSRSKSQGRSKSRGKTKLECWHCGKKGHIKKDCWNRKGKESESSNNNNESTSNQEANIVGELVQDALIMSHEKNGDYWVLDSGASFHATPHKNYFSNYTQGDFGQVLLGNAHPCKIVGIGNITMKLPNGTQWTLNDARHIPDLKRNLISTSKLDKEGYVMTFGNGNWKVTKGSMVFAKGNLVGSLYLLTNIFDYSLNLVSIGNDASLWHNRLRHMSKKGMKMLHCNGSLPNLKEVDLGFCEDCVYGK